MLLDQRQFVVKERMAVMKLTDTYDILDPTTSRPVAIARDEPPGWAKWLRLLMHKRLLPTTVNVRESEGRQPVLSLRRKPGLFRSTVIVSDASGTVLGSLRSKVISLGGGFFVHSRDGRQVAEVKGDWKGWNFRLLDSGGRELGVVTKKWAGLGQELFTTADTYVVSLSASASAGPASTGLLLAAGLAIDLIFKEK